MSFIHEALKKAQKEKDARYHEYHGIVSVPGYKPRIFSGKTLLWTSFLLIPLAFAAYLWLPYRDTQPPNPEPVTPVATPQPESLVNAATLYEKARFFQKNGRLQEAKLLYEEILSLDPDYVDALNNLGVIHIHDKDYSAARAYFSKAVLLKPDYVDSHYNLACLHALEGEVSQSLVHLKKAISLNQSVKDWVRSDTDLQKLHGVPGFKEIIRKNGGIE